MDGNYGGTLDVRLSVANTIVFLDFPRILCLSRVIKPRFMYARQSRPDMASDCPERLNWQFLKYIWSYPIIRRRGILENLSQVMLNQQVTILRKPTQIIDFLQNIFHY
ncbi:hypothetical protein [Nostoc sp.]|uniref:hypothetical protein n=1 Tax=Nostoc sp. TaxID=1180 RepID=UPI002FF7C610